MNIITFANKTDLFGSNHLIFLFLSIGVIITGSILSIKYLKVETMHKILLIVGIVSESIKVFTYIINNELNLGGYLAKGDLPFHLCSIQIIFFVILNFSKNEKVKHLLHGFMVPTCLVGGAAALFLATASSRSMPLIGIQYFGFHSAIVIFAIYLLSGKATEFTIKDFRNTLIMLFVTLFIAIYVNSILYYREFDPEVFNALLNEGKTQAEAIEGAMQLKNINFMYVVNPPQDGLPYLAKYPIGGTDGWIVYIIHYALLAVVVVALTFIKPIIKELKNVKKKLAKAK